MSDIDKAEVSVVSDIDKAVSLISFLEGDEGTLGWDVIDYVVFLTPKDIGIVYCKQEFEALDARMSPGGVGDLPILLFAFRYGRDGLSRYLSGVVGPTRFEKLKSGNVGDLGIQDARLVS